jgi:hypothetical protein
MGLYFGISVQNGQWLTPWFFHIITRLVEYTSGISHISFSQWRHKGLACVHASTSRHFTHHVREVLLQWSTEAELLGTRSGPIDGWARHFQQSEKLLRLFWDAQDIFEAEHFLWPDILKVSVHLWVLILNPSVFFTGLKHYLWEGKVASITLVVMLWNRSFIFYYFLFCWTSSLHKWCM